MKAVRLSILMIVFLVFVPSNAGSQTWVKYEGYSTRTVYRLLADSTGVYAGSLGGGIFRSTDNGDSWTPSNDGSTIQSVGSLARIGTTLIVGGIQGGRSAVQGVMFRSTTNGASWIRSDTGIVGSELRSMTVASGSIFVGSYGAGVFRSTDNGSTWTAYNAGLTNTAVQSVASDDNYIYAGTSGTGVFRRSLTAGNWTAVNTGISSIVVRHIYVDGPNVFALTDGGGICRSTNQGTSWTPVNSGLGSLFVRGLIRSGSVLLAGTERGMFASTDDGITWTGRSVGLDSAFIYSVASSGAWVYTATKEGVYKSSDLGLTWVPSGNGIVAYPPVNSITALQPDLGGSPDRMLLGTWGAGIRRGSSTSVGATFEEVYGLPYPFVSTVLVQGDNMYVGTSGRGAFRGRDSAWTSGSTGLISQSVELITRRGSALYASLAGGGIAKSTDSGATWISRNFGLAGLQTWSLVHIGDTMLTSVYGAWVSRSTDDGASWNTVNTGFTTGAISELLLTSDADGKPVVFAGSYGGGVFRSTNNGLSWTPVNTGLGDLTINAMAALEKDQQRSVYVGTPTGVYESTDLGASWSVKYPGTMTRPDVISLGVVGDVLVAGTLDAGLWYADIVAGVERVSNEIPSDFELKQNYPNPFNPSTTIRFSVPSSGHVSLSIYDLLGRQVAILADELVPAGAHAVRWHATGMPSGVYVARLQSGDKTQIRRMLLMK